VDTFPLYERNIIDEISSTISSNSGCCSTGIW